MTVPQLSSFYDFVELIYCGIKNDEKENWNKSSRSPVDFLDGPVIRINGDCLMLGVIFSFFLQLITTKVMR